MVNVRADMHAEGYSSTSLLQTKFSAPPIRDNLVLRPRLSQQLSASLTRPLIVISAPAGFGKSTMITEWRASKPDMTLPIAWLSLDEDDNEITRFLTYFIGAIDTIMPDFGRDLYPLLRAPQPPTSKSILTLLINRLSTAGLEFALVLDDYHSIMTQAIHEAVDYLLDHMPPSMHLIITSRADPPLRLSRLRVRGQIIEIRADDLRFTPEEVGDFLNRVFGLRPSDAEIQALGERTEGWAAGLQLAALAMQGREQLSGFIQTFTGNHRYIIDYLVEEVLSRQPEQVYDFLLQTSILDRMSAEVCTVVTGQDNAQDMLDYLERSNLFIIPLDEVGQWYRYHHLFSNVLRHRLRQNHSVTELHIRASDWFKQQGLIDEAMRHALAVSNYDRAAVIIESLSPTFEDTGDLIKLRSWLNQIPFDYIQNRALLMIAYGWMLGLSGEYSKVEMLIAEAPSLNTPDLTPDIKGRVALLRSNLARWQGRNQAIKEYAREALENLPESNVSARVHATAELITAHRREGNLMASREAYHQAMSLAEAAGNRRLVMWLQHLLNILLWWEAQPRQVIATSERVVKMYEQFESSQVLIAALSQIFIGIMSYELNDLDKAEAMTLRGIEIARLSAEKYMLTYGYICLASIYQARGAFARALDTIDRGKLWFAEMQVVGEGALHMLDAYYARLCIQQGDLDAALRWAQTKFSNPADRNTQFSEELTLVRLNLARIRLGYDESLFTQAKSLLDQIRAEAESKKWTLLIIQCLGLQALMFEAAGDSDQALATLEHLLKLTEPREYVRTYVDEGAPMKALLKQTLARGIMPDYTQKLLSAFQGETPRPILHASPVQDSLIEPLSERELEILHLLMEGDSNREIAARLFVSLGTVKKHINNIFGKLHVESRTQAIAAAKNLNLT